MSNEHMQRFAHFPVRKRLGSRGRYWGGEELRGADTVFPKGGVSNCFLVIMRTYKGLKQHWETHRYTTTDT